MTPLGPLVLAACSQNIDFKLANMFLDNLLNIKDIPTIVKFIFAGVVEMLPGESINLAAAQPSLATPLELPISPVKLNWIRNLN